jgi:uncharacterized membrane protein
MGSRITFVLTLALAALSTSSAIAKPDYLEPFQNYFKANSGPIAERACANCHVSNSDYGLNLLGKEIAHEKVAANSKSLTDAILLKVASLDANGDGVSNADEVAAGKDPSVAVAGAKPVETTPEPPQKKSIIPKNAFHPAIVHFPIALFLGGILLDAVGYRRRNTTLLWAGWYNLLFASITTFAALISGYVATLFMKIPIAGLIQEHMIYALGSTVLMWAMVGIRARRHEKLQGGLLGVYFAIALVSVFLISWSGHLGGVFVYGE